MALKTTRGPVPANAYSLSEQEAVSYQWQQLKRWPSHWDTWPIVYGVPTMAFIAGVSGLLINQHYRQKLKLRRFGYISTRVAMAFAPTLLTLGPHYLFITNPLLIDKHKCTPCSYICAAALQIGASTIFPMMTAPLANFTFAFRYGTYALPYWSDFRGTIKLIFAMHKTLLPKLTIILPLQILVSLFITHMEIRTLQIMKRKLDNGEVECISPFELN